MNLQELLGALEATCEAKGQADRLEVDAVILLAAKNELKEQAQLRKDLEQARDEASMRPSVARKLNEKIRALEAELEQLRTNKKVKDLEKKVAFLSEELKQSYTTKNFTLKKQLLDLEKQYRSHINVDPAMAAFWADVTVLMDENREKDAALRFTGPPSALPAPRQSAAGSHPDTAATPAAAAAAAVATEQATGASTETSGSEQHTENANNTDSHDNSTTGSASRAAAAAESSSSNSARGTSLQSHPACGVQSQVEAFTSKINEEAASAAAVLHDGLGSHHSSSGGAMNRTASGEVVVRHGAGFRVVRAPGLADGTAATGTAAAAGAVVEEHLQPVHIVKDTIANKIKDVTFRALPADFGSHLDEQQLRQLQHIIDARALDSQADAICTSVNVLQQLFADAAAAGTAKVDLQQQVQQLAAAAQQLSTAAADATTLQQRQAEAEALLASVQELRQTFSSSSGAGNSSAAATAVVKQLSAVQQEVQQLQQLQQKASRETSSQALLLQVFKDFLDQLEQQGLMAPAAAAAAAEGQPSQQHVLVELLQSFLQANPQLPQLLAARIAPPSSTPAAAEAAAFSMHRAPSVHVSTQANAETAHAATQHDPLAPPTVHAETQSDAWPPLSVHVSTQADPPASAGVHVSTQADPLPSPSVHAAVQAVLAAEQATAAVQTAAAEQAHASTQAAGVAEQSSAGVQTEPSIGLEEPQAAAATAELSSDSTEPDAAAATVAAAVDTDTQQGVASPAAAAAAAGVPAYAAAAAEAAAREMAVGGSSVLPPLPPNIPGRPSETYALRKQGSGIIYSASGSELSIGKVAVGTQLDLLHELRRKKGGEAAAGAEEHQPSGAAAAATAQPPVVAGGGGGAAAAAAGSPPEANDPGSHVALMLTVKAEELTDMEAVARELSKLRADNMELAANMSVTQSLVEHLNKTMKDAIDKADDAEAETAQLKHQLAEATAALQQLESEHVELTKVLIDAKVEIAEKKGQLVALVRNLRRAVESSQPHGIKQEVQLILSDVPDVGAAAGSDTSIEQSQTSHTVSRLLERVSSSRGTIGNFTANLGHALGSGGSRIMGHAPSKRRSSDNGTVAVPAAVLPERTASGAAALAAAGAAVPESRQVVHDRQ